MHETNYKNDYYDVAKDDSIHVQYFVYGKKPLVMYPITEEMIKAQIEEDLEEEARTEWMLSNYILDDDPWGCYDC